MSLRPRKDTVYAISISYGREVGIFYLQRNELGRFIKGCTSDKRKQWTGNVYGKLTVIDTEYNVGEERKRTICICQCACGNTTRVPADKLHSGRKTSCGCDSMERRKQKLRKDLTGQRFGKLLVIEMIYSDHGGKTHAKCRCDCGNITMVIGTQLTSGKTVSCGCYRRELASGRFINLTGQKAKNGVIFLSLEGQTEHGVRKWKCLCPYCNETFIAIPAKIFSGHTNSCGCIRGSVRAKYIEQILIDMKINYKKEYRFSDCRDTYALPFDFAIFDKFGSLIHLIEYDGEQHYWPISCYGGTDGFEKTHLHDQIKNEYCSRNGLHLIRLPYTLSNAEIKEVIANTVNP